MSEPQNDVRGFATIPRAVLYDETLPTDAKMVYLVLSSHVGAKDTVWPSHARMAVEAGVSVSQVKRMLKLLRDRQLIEWTSRIVGKMQTSNEYRLISGTPAPSPTIPGSSQGTGVKGNRGHREPRPVRTAPPSTVSDERESLNKPTSTTLARRGTRLPDDWRRTAADVEWQTAQGIPDDFARPVTEEFKNYWWAQSGAKACKLDWSKAWRNWTLRDWRRDGARWQRERGGTDTRTVRDFNAERAAAAELARVNEAGWMRNA